MNVTRYRWVARWVVVLLAVVTAACSAEKMVEEEDRPPIIVRGGSIIFETKVTREHPNPLDWTEDPPFWMPVQPNGKPVTGATAVVTGGQGNCNNLSGRLFVVTFSDGSDEETFNIVTAGREPKVLGTGELRPGSASKWIEYGTSGQGHISRLRVPPSRQPCNFTPNSNARIELTFTY